MVISKAGQPGARPGVICSRFHARDGAPPCSIGSSPGNNVLPSPARVCCPEPSQQVVQPALSTRMDHLPDDVLLVVMSHLRTWDLFSCRLVCKRFAPLALHPEVWRHRNLWEPFNRDYVNVLFCPVLRLAPCLDDLRITLPSPHTCHSLFTGPCATKRLYIEIREPSGAAQAALLIRHQRELGRLKGIHLHLLDEQSGLRPEFSVADTSVLFGTVVSTPGLHYLDISPAGDELLPIKSSPRWLHPTIEASMTDFSCPWSPALEHFFNCMLAVHAASLEVVEMREYTFEFNSPSTVALLAQLPALVELFCSVFPGMEALAECATLRHIHLEINPQKDHVRAYAPAAASFLRRARQLRTLQLKYEDEGDVGVELITALASSGRSGVEVLRIDYDPCDIEAHLPELLGALASLPALRRLIVNVEKDSPHAQKILAATSSIQVEFK
ncbi:uncharacterized protein LOC127749282 [Frankliniella occidentalis]|uniref:Uncharacterized protein LOC127749282 n=1 Tax=Frankliniella occidentalis TaxID=133901 RepID=A0A9C6TUP1_FRAOC|nr:uncharacterized protein LOC127749282 [Frankliniella occidentalis]